MNWFARRFKYTRALEEEVLALTDATNELTNQLAIKQAWEDWIIGIIDDLRELLPGEKRPIAPSKVLEAFAERAVVDLGTLMAACVDYRNLLIRADVPDSVSGRHEGVEKIFGKYGVVLERRKDSIRGMWSAYMDSISSSDQTDPNYTYETRTRKISDHSE